MLTLAHFNPSITFPKLKGEYVDLVATENFKIQRVVADHTVYFLGMLDNKGISGSSCPNNLDSHPDIFSVENMRCAYTTISRMMSFVMATVYDVTQRIAYLDELIVLTRQLNDTEGYVEERVKARLDADPKAVKLELNAPVSENETIITASEVWHVHPSFNDYAVRAKYEGIGLSIAALWGVEKIRYAISLERSNYSLKTFIDVGFEVTNPEELVNAKLEEFNTLQEFIPYESEEPNVPEEEV